MTDDAAGENLLRTLAPLLRGLGTAVRTWREKPRAVPFTAVQRAELDGLQDDLDRQVAALDVDRPILVVALMGGTGVGKSTLMNALAGSAIAASSITRPTTRDPVVYHHQSIRPERLDPALRLCRLVAHDRATLLQKVIVDTPDLDSNDLENRDKLARILPVADLVLYVGSQEKYHDRLGWDLFKEQRARRAFAFVLNKWDRCVQTSATGTRPDDDLLTDLKNEGFTDPKLFRTTAQRWVDAALAGKDRPDDLPPGEQFPELRNWLELGLTRLEIEAVKARGVSSLLQQLDRTVAATRPAELGPIVDATRIAWDPVLDQEAATQADVLANTLEPFQQDVEHQFSVRGQQRFRGLMAGYLRLTTKLRYAGAAFRDRSMLTPKLTPSDRASDWDLAGVAHDCARIAEERSITARITALTSRLLVEADRCGFPVALLDGPTSAAAKNDWHDRLTRGLVDSLGAVERSVTQPTGLRRLTRGLIATLSNILPEVAFVSSIAIVLWQLVYQLQTPSLAIVLMPLYVTLGVLVLLHVLITIFLPVRWAGIKSDFRDELAKGLSTELKTVFLPVPNEVAAAIAADRKATDAVAAEIREVAGWLRERETKAGVGDLYGHTP